MLSKDVVIFNKITLSKKYNQYLMTWYDNTFELNISFKKKYGISFCFHKNIIMPINIFIYFIHKRFRHVSKITKIHFFSLF